MHWKLYLYRKDRLGEIHKLATQADVYALMCSSSFVAKCRADGYDGWEMRQEHPKR